MGIEKIFHESQLIAIIMRTGDRSEGTRFHTDNDSALQLGEFNLDKGHVIEPHIHRLVDRKINRTQEVLIIQEGTVRVDLYDDQQVYIESHMLASGDIILLSSGGHGFTMLENTVMVEVKTGPYAGEQDKTRYSPIDESKLVMKV